VGRTLSDIDLRAKTGATVLAIQRDGSRVILPTGRERLEVADVLAISGSRDAVLEAQTILNAETA
jgi:CPA2 family monovalent cation:H+ antiporter-2